jgi:hypothetical protein
MAEVYKNFSDYQPSKLVKNYRHFRNLLCPSYEILIFGTEMLPEISVIFNQLPWLTA